MKKPFQEFVLADNVVKQMLIMKRILKLMETRTKDTIECIDIIYRK